MKKRLFFLFLAILLSGGIIFMGLKYQKAVVKNKETTTKSSSQTTTTKSTEVSREETTSKMVEIYVDPALYDVNATEETENDYVKVRQSTSEDSEVLTKLHRGEWATYLATTGEYVKVQANSGKIGYIPKENAGTITEVTRLAPASSLQELSVVLDAGHGGIDSGAESVDGSVLEKDLTLQTVKAVGEMLASKGVKVTYTRQEDTLLSLEDVTKVSMNNNPDLFLSFHYDNFDTPNGMQGFTTYYYYQEGEPLAQTIADQLMESLPLTSNGVRFGNYYVLRQSYVPQSILIEGGYLNSDHDLPVVSQVDYPQKVATGVLAALQEYVKEN